MEFTLVDTTYSWKGDESLHMKHISFHRMQALLETKDVYGVYEFHSLPMDAKGVTTSPEVAESSNSWLDLIPLVSYGDIVEFVAFFIENE
ncbi:hypothetical protein Tco_1226820 [Tanacetum coccineum]